MNGFWVLLILSDFQNFRVKIFEKHNAEVYWNHFLSDLNKVILTCPDYILWKYVNPNKNLHSKNQQLFEMNEFLWKVFLFGQLIVFPYHLKGSDINDLWWLTDLPL